MEIRTGPPPSINLNQQHVSQQRSVPISDPDDLQEVHRLPVEVISFTNPKVERSAWAAIAANMEEGATVEMG